MTALSAIIVEDVAAARENLRRILASHCPEIRVLGEAASVVEAAKLIKKEEANLLFLDVELPDGTSFDLLDILGEWPGEIIFTTAMEHYALRAFRYAAADYLLKPIIAEELVAAVKRVQSKKSPPQQRQYLQEAARQKGPLERIVLASQDKLSLVEIADIIRCEADNNYTQIYLKKGRRELVSQPLKHYAELLGEHQFLRVHQSHLVNAKAIAEYIKLDGGYLLMIDGSRIPVSVRRRSVVLDFFKMGQ